MLSSTRFAEIVIAVVVFLMGVVCGDVIRSTKCEKDTRTAERAFGYATEISFVSVREFDYAKEVIGADSADSVVLVRGRVFMPDTLMPRLPQIPFAEENDE